MGNDVYGLRTRICGTYVNHWQTLLSSPTVGNILLAGHLPVFAFDGFIFQTPAHDKVMTLSSQNHFDGGSRFALVGALTPTGVFNAYFLAGRSGVAV